MPSRQAARRLRRRRLRCAREDRAAARSSVLCPQTFDEKVADRFHAAHMIIEFGFAARLRLGDALIDGTALADLILDFLDQHPEGEFLPHAPLSSSASRYFRSARSSSGLTPSSSRRIRAIMRS